jgi:hypothetical protein
MEEGEWVGSIEMATKCGECFTITGNGKMNTKFEYEEWCLLGCYAVWLL